MVNDVCLELLPVKVKSHAEKQVLYGHMELDVFLENALADAGDRGRVGRRSASASAHSRGANLCVKGLTLKYNNRCGTGASFHSS